MKNKKLYFTSYLLMIFSTIAILISLVFLPDIVPLRYDFEGNAVASGSKYFYLIYILVILVSGLALTLVARTQGRKEAYVNEKYIITGNICLIILVNVIIFYFIIMSYRNITSDFGEPVTKITSLVAILLGVFLFAMGLVMPKLTLNSAIGLRTSWSMYNDNVWKKSQKAGGFTMAISGVIIAFLSVLLEGQWPLISAAIILFIDAIVSIFISYFIYNKEIAQEKENNNSQQNPEI
ncbi:MAG: SdpI family protein [Crenarchaeota archaeon]|nr:SdpI family protein [Thermoproteota archaeon]